MILKIILGLIILLVPFFALINDINYLTSVLNQENRNLNIDKGKLQSRLEANQNQAGSDLTLEIEDKVRNGTIEFISPISSTSIIQVPPSKSTASPTVNPENPTNKPNNGQGVISR